MSGIFALTFPRFLTDLLYRDTLKRHLLGHADEASSSDHKENNTGLTEIDQFLDIESDPMNLDLVKTANLDWFDELTTTIQPAFSEFHSPIRHIRDAPGQLGGDAAIRPVSELDSATVSQSGSTAVIGCRESNSQYLLRESLGSTSSDKPIELKLPPELFNSMVDDYARKWLRELCNK